MRPRKNKEIIDFWKKYPIYCYYNYFFSEVSEKTLLIPRMEQDLLSETPGFPRIITHPGIMEFFEVTP